MSGLAPHLIAALIFVACALVHIACAVLVDWVLAPRHRRRTGRELVEPVPPFPGLGGLIAGMSLLAPGMSRRQRYNVTIQLASPAWRVVTMVSAVSVWIGLIALVLAVILRPD
jgi:hypothetical protein